MGRLALAVRFETGKQCPDRVLMAPRFLLEGIVTVFIGIFSWGLMPPGPCQTRNWFRGKNGWFTDREEAIMVNRLLRDDPSKGDMNNR